MTRCLIVVAKRPIPGQVKTCIAPTIGATQATELYRCALVDTLELVTGFRGVEHLIRSSSRRIWSICCATSAVRWQTFGADEALRTGQMVAVPEV